MRKSLLQLSIGALIGSIILPADRLPAQQATTVEALSWGAVKDLVQRLGRLATPLKKGDQ